MSRSTARAPNESWAGEEDKGRRGALRIFVVVGAAVLVLGVAFAIRGRSDGRSRKVGDIIERAYPGATVERCRPADGSPLGSGVMTCVIGRSTPQLRHDLVRYSGTEGPPTDRLCLIYVGEQVSLFGYAAPRGSLPCAGSSRRGRSGSRAASTQYSAAIPTDGGSGDPGRRGFPLDRRSSLL